MFNSKDVEYIQHVKAGFITRLLGYKDLVDLGPKRVAMGIFFTNTVDNFGTDYADFYFLETKTSQGNNISFLISKQDASKLGLKQGYSYTVICNGRQKIQSNNNLVYKMLNCTTVIAFKKINFDNTINDIRKDKIIIGD